MSDKTHAPSPRVLHPRTSKKEMGCYRFKHVLTPSSQKDVVQLQLPAEQEGLVIYPLRYALLQHDFPLERFPTLDVSAYPEVGEGYFRGVRELRPRTHLYLFYTQDGVFKHKHYVVTDEVQFAEIPPPAPEPETRQDTDGAPLREFPVVEASHAYITAPLPTPQRRLGEMAYLLTCDTMLTETVLARLAQDEAGLRSQTTTAFKLLGGTQQPHVLAIEALKDIPALRDDEDQRLKHIAWSESQPEEMLGDDFLIKSSRHASASHPYAPLAIALHDPVGVMSEMGHLTGQPVLALQAWSEQEQVPRKVLVSKWIDGLGEQKAAEVEQDMKENDPVYRILPAENQGQAQKTRDRIYRSGLEAKAERLSYARNDERAAFMASYEQKHQTFIAAIDAAAALATAVYRSLRPRHEAVMKLFDETDAESFICLRRAVTYSLCVLACDAQGRQVLEAMLPASGPTGLMERALLGYPDIKKLVDQTMAQQAGRDATELGVEAMLALLTQVPADDASRYLGSVVTELVMRGRLRSAEAFRRSTYYLALQLLDGDLVRKEAVPLRDAGKWLLEKNGGQPVHGFRPVTIARHANELIYLYTSEPVQAALNEQRRELRQRLNFWHGIRFGVGALGVFLSTRSLVTVMNQFGQADGDVLVHSLNLASGLLATGSGVAAIGETQLQWRAGIAATYAQEEAAELLDNRSKKFGNWAIGLLALAAVAESIKEAGKALMASTSEARAAHVATATLQGAAATVGVLHLIGRLAEQDSIFGKKAIELLGAASASKGIVARGASVALGITRLGAGPVGWLLIGVEVAITEFWKWRKRVAEEKKVTDWIARSIWGTGLHSGEPAFDALEEVTGYYRFFLAPHIETDVAVLRTLGSALVPLWRVYNGLSQGSVLPQDARTVTLALPGWLPQVGRYEVVQYNEFKVTGVQRTVNDPAKVIIRNGVGYLTYETSTLGGDIQVRYWPNAFAEPEVVLTSTQVSL